MLLVELSLKWVDKRGGTAELEITAGGRSGFECGAGKGLDEWLEKERKRAGAGSGRILARQ
jgi:hypothetical protein